MCTRALQLRSVFGIAIVCLHGYFGEPAFAEQKHPLSVESALALRSFGDLSSIEFSPDGKWLAYVVRDSARIFSRSDDARFTSGIPTWVCGDDIYISNTKTGETRILTGGKGENWLPSWSPEGRYLAFLSNRDGSGQAKLWIWDSLDNELRKVSDTKVRTEQIEWMPDGRRIVVTVVPDKLSAEEYLRKVQSGAEGSGIAIDKEAGSTVILYQSKAATKDQKGSVQSDPWNLGKNLRDLAAVDLTTGDASLTTRDRKIATFKLSPDGSRIAFTIPKRFEMPGSQQILYDLATITLISGEERIIASDIRLDYDGAEFSWSPDNTLLSYHAGGPGEKVRDCYIASTDGKPPRNVTNLAAPEEASGLKASVPLWDEHENIYFVRNGALWRASLGQRAASEIARVPNRDILACLRAPSSNLLGKVSRGDSTVVVTHDDDEKQDGFYKINLTDGRSTKLLEKGQCYTCDNLTNPFTETQDGHRLAYIAEDAQHDPDVWINDPSFQQAERLTQLNPQFDSLKMGAARLVDWLSNDGQRLHGALLLPSGFEEGVRYPLVVWVYAGSSLSSHLDHFGLGERGPFNFQLLATRGYAVLLPDSPQGRGNPMQELAKTVLPGINKVIEMGIADPGRLGVMGQSNGGYSTLALIVQSKRFKVAVEMDGMGDLVGLYSEMDRAGTAFGTSLEHGYDALGGTPWEFRERYIENSPFFYLDRTETPLLIVHGGQDSAVAPSLGDQLFVGLRRLGKEVQYAKYEGEGHSQLYWSHANQKDLCDRMLSWLQKYLKPSDH